MTVADPSLPSAAEIRRAWKGEMAAAFPCAPSGPGFHDTALFEPTRPPGHWAFSRLRFLVTLNLIRSLPGTEVLDVAAGPCFMALALQAAGKRVTANDLRPLDAPLSVWSVGDQIRRFTGDIFSQSPAALGRFEIVLCSELIEHVAHPAHLVAHLKTFLRPGGRLVVTTPNGSFLASRLPTLLEAQDPHELERRQFQPDSEGHLFLTTPAELQGLLAQAGFTVERTLLFGSPAVTGHLKVRHLRSLGWPAFWYLGERLAQAAPRPFRERILSHILMCARTD